MRVRSIQLLGLALALGCGQSLFDDNTGDLDAGGDPADARVSDASPSEPDGRLNSACPEPCLGDATSDFDGSQGGSTGAWQYFSDNRDRTWIAMTPGLSGGLTGFVGVGTVGVFACADNLAASECTTHADAVLLVPRDAPASAADPAVRFTMPKTAAVTVSGAYDPALAGGGNHELLVYRNTREDLVFARVFDAQQPGAAYSFDLEAVQGDHLYFVIRLPADGTAAPIALKAYVTERAGAFPSACQLTARFETPGASTTTGDCEGRQWELRQGVAQTVGTSAAVASVIPDLGQAWSAGTGHYWHPTSGNPIDYTGDYTVQFWARATAPGTGVVTIYSDAHASADGGIDIQLNAAGELFFNFLFPGVQGTGGQLNENTAWPADGDWHFVRLTRNASAENFRVCVDGVLKIGRGVIGSEFGNTSDDRPYFGRNAILDAPAYDGSALDDVRVFKRALLCE